MIRAGKAPLVALLVSALWFPSATTTTATLRSPVRSTGDLVVVGHHDLDRSGFNADVYALGDFAYVGDFGRRSDGYPCPAKGVRVIDISDPANPVSASVLQNPRRTSAEDVVVQHVDTPAFTGDLAVAGIQNCRGDRRVFRGLQLFDVTQPYAPREVGRWRARGFTHGCHEIDMTTSSTARGRTRVLVGCALPFAEVHNGDEVAIVDATDPYSPEKIGGFALFKDTGLSRTGGTGCFKAIYAHSVRFFDDGAGLYVSYWDAGTILLDVSDPRSPAAKGRTLITSANVDGDNHSMALARGGRTLLINSEDWSPDRSSFGAGCSQRYGGWGELYIYDNREPTGTRFITSFGTDNSKTTRHDGIYSVHNTEVVQQDQVFASWFSDGIRWIDISRAARPVERARFRPRFFRDPYGVLPPSPLVWGVWPHPDKGVILVSDINSGLWILRAKGLDF